MKPSKSMEAILAAIARQEAADREAEDAKMARELAAQFAEVEVKVKSDERIAQELAQSEQDAQIARDLAQSEKDSQLARELATHSRKDKKIALESEQGGDALDVLARQDQERQDADYALALQTQYGLSKSKNRSQYDVKEDADAALARALQEMEDGRAAQGHLSEEMLAIYQQIPKYWEGKTAEERKKIEESLHAILVSPAVRGEEGVAGLTDAHKFTRTLIRAGIPVLTAIDDQFKLSSLALTPDQVLKEVLEFLEKLKKDGADSRISIENIQKTFAHVARNAAVEAAETGANVHHLLSRTWSLAKKMGRDGMAAVATLLSDNIGDGGSCIPGLIARLYSPYAKMLALHLGIEASVPRPAAAKPPGK